MKRRASHLAVKVNQVPLEVMGQNVGLQEAQKNRGGGKGGKEPYKKSVGTGREHVSALHAKMLDRCSQRK